MVLLTSLLLCLSATAALGQADYSQYVNPFIGSSGPFEGLAFGGGDIFVGGALPFGVVKMGIDTYEDNVTFSTFNGGNTPQGRVTAISMMHESGTGGAPKYGLVPQMPLTSLEGVDLLDNRHTGRAESAGTMPVLDIFRASSTTASISASVPVGTPVS